MKTDMQLKKEVEAELGWDPAVNAATIGVGVKERVVTLSGHLSSYAEKLAAEKAAQRIAGVKAVIVELDVRVPNAEKRSDEEIANAVRSILRWTVGVDEEAVKVQVERGVVTLSGEVVSGYQKQKAEHAIRNVCGVAGVFNEIRVNSPAVSTDMGRIIEEALQRHAQFEAKHIRIDVKDGTVTLGGTVDSFAEKNAIRNAAWAAPGVRTVVDNLVIG